MVLIRPIFFSILILVFRLNELHAVEKKDKTKETHVILSNYKNLMKDGEYLRPNYFGPLYPLRNDFFYENYPSQIYFAPYFELEKKVTSVFPSIGCSDYSMDKSFDYSRYLYRLITISYLFENLRELRRTALGLGGFAFVCPMGKNLFDDCNPHDEEMKKFLSRIENKVEEWSFVTDKMIENTEVEKFISEINNGTSPIESKKISTYRIKEFCQKNNNCPKNIQEILKSIGQICRMDIALIKNICSERDHLMGMSKVPLASKLILESNTVSVINLVESGEACLNRFSRELEGKESYPSYIKGIFPLIHEKILNEKERRYKQGLLFLPGALKEFDDKGLKDFLYARPTPTPLALVVTPTPTPTPTPKPEVVVIVPIPTPTPVVVVPTPTPTPVEIKRTQFYLSSQKRKEGDKESVAVDMEKFKNDLGVPADQLKDYKAIFEHYSKRESLLEMKNFDKLGSVHEPFRLIFLKYLLDNKIHQGLFNVQSVMGEKFFVVNDIDQTQEAEYIQLKSGAKNSVGWEITILKHPKKEEEVKTPSSKSKSPKK